MCDRSSIFLGPSVISCNFFNTMRKGSSSYSLVISFEEAFKIWEGKFTHPSHPSECRPFNTSSMSVRIETQGHSYQATIHSPAWMDLVHRLRGHDLVSGKVIKNLHWDLLSMVVFQVEPTLKPYDTYVPPMNSHRTQDGPLNSLDEVDAAPQTRCH